MPKLWQRYLVEASVDGVRWQILADYRNSFRDAPHNYIELDQPIEARYIRYRHHYVPGKNLAMGIFACSVWDVGKTGYGKRFYGSA